MSIEQGAAFAEGLRELSDAFRANSKETTEGYLNDLSGITQEFQEESHTYAKDMVTLADKYVSDIQTLYQNIYPEPA